MLDSIILGLIQGLTEFLPVSSSGHLIIIREFLHLPLENTLSFDIFLNTATLFAIIHCFWGDIRRVFIDLKTEGLSSRSKNLLFCIIIGTIPAGFIGYRFGDPIENIFRSTHWVALALIFGSILMFVADRVSFRKPTAQMGGIEPLKALVVGLFQALAFIPGISRSGATISGGLISKLSREEAIRFSFLLYIPISLGAALKAFLDLNSSSSTIPYSLFTIQSALGFLAALFSGVWAIKFLLRYLSRHSFIPFIIYRLALAVILFLFLQ